MEKLDMATPDKVAENIKRIRELFPNCCTERMDREGKVVAAIDFDLLRQELSSEAVEGYEERYRFEWPGKRESIRLANTPTTQTLRPCRAESVDFDTTQNLYIEGDNLQVLKILQNTYFKKVKMIYIDPPYNTGNDFVYHDSLKMDRETWKEVGGQSDEEGNQLLQRYVRNAETNGSYHSDWCSMIYPRLLVARELLSDDGVIFISIDDNEVHNLRKICDEVFGAKNFVAEFVWEQGRKSMASQVAVNHEYCLVYCRNKKCSIESDGHRTMWRTKKKGLGEIYAEYNRLKNLHGDNLSLIEQGLKIFYKGLPESHPSRANAHYCKVDQYLGIYHPDNISQGTGKGGHFDILHPKTGKPCKVPTGGWRFSEEKLPELLASHKIVFGKDESIIPCLKRYLRETEYEVCSSVFYKDGRGASSRLNRLLGGSFFDYPKDEEIIKYFISMVSSSDDIILDFFSGAATTAHAVMQLNAEDGGKRKYIMVQLPEETPEGARHARLVIRIFARLVRSVSAVPGVRS